MRDPGLRNKALKYHSWSIILVSWHSRWEKSWNVFSRASRHQSPQRWTSIQLEPGFLSGRRCSCWMQKGSETFPACSWIYRLRTQWMQKHQQDVSSCHYLQLGCCCPAPVGWWFIKSYLCLSQYFLLLSYLFAVSSAAPLHCFDLWFMLFYFLQSSAVFIYVALKSRFANVPVPATPSRPPSLPAHNIISFFWISHCFYRE